MFVELILLIMSVVVIFLGRGAHYYLCETHKEDVAKKNFKICGKLFLVALLVEFLMTLSNGIK